MTVGTPGTGIGGLFYLLLAMWMPVRHVYSVIRGRALPGAWKIVASTLAQGSAMIGALYGEAWVIKCHLGPMLARLPLGASHTASAKANMAVHMVAVAPCLALLPLLVLGLVVLVVHTARFLGLSERGRRERALRATTPLPPTAAAVVVPVKER